MTAVKDAVQAHTSLCLFEAAALMLESSDIRGAARTQDAALKAVKILRAEQQYLVRAYDRAIAKAGKE